MSHCNCCVIKVNDKVNEMNNLIKDLQEDHQKQINKLKKMIEIDRSHKTMLINDIATDVHKLKSKNDE